MLGISVSDAVLVVGVFVSLLAAIKGMRTGEQAKQATPPVPDFALIGGTLVDRAVLGELTRAVVALTDAITQGARADERSAQNALIQALMRKLDVA